MILEETINELTRLMLKDYAEKHDKKRMGLYKFCIKLIKVIQTCE